MRREQQQKEMQHEQQQSNSWQFLDHQVGTSESCAPATSLKQVSSSSVGCIHFDYKSDFQTTGDGGDKKDGLWDFLDKRKATRQK